MASKKVGVSQGCFCDKLEDDSLTLFVLSLCVIALRRHGYSELSVVLKAEPRPSHNLKPLGFWVWGLPIGP